MNERDKRMNEWKLTFTRALNSYETLAAQHTHYVLCLGLDDYPQHKQDAARLVAKAELRRIANAAKRYG